MGKIDWVKYIKESEYLGFVTLYSLYNMKHTFSESITYKYNDLNFHSSNFEALSIEDFAFVFKEIIEPNLYTNKIDQGFILYDENKVPSYFFDVVDSIEILVYKLSNLINYYYINISNICWDNIEKKFVYILLII